MNKIHVTIVALLLGAAAALGVAAATHTAGLQARSVKSHTLSSTVIAARAHRLDELERSIASARRDRPPALPKVPVAHATTPIPAQHVVYRRPAPIVVVKHNPHHESDHEQEGGND